jgi:hypothetical protein
MWGPPARPALRRGARSHRPRICVRRLCDDRHMKKKPPVSSSGWTAPWGKQPPVPTPPPGWSPPSGQQPPPPYQAQQVPPPAFPGWSQPPHEEPTSGVGSRWTAPSTWGTRPMGSPEAQPEGPPGRFIELKPRPVFWVGLGGMLLLGLLGAVSSGIGSALWLMSLVPFGTALVALIRRRRTFWLGSATTGGVATLLAGSLALGGVGLALIPASGATVAQPRTVAFASPSIIRTTPVAPPTISATPTPTPSDTPTPSITPSASDTPTPTPTPPQPVAFPTQTTQATSAPTTAAPAPATTAAPPPPPATQYVGGTVVKGQFCKNINAGWYGYTASHQLVQCRPATPGGKNQWLSP